MRRNLMMVLLLGLAAACAQNPPAASQKSSTVAAPAPPQGKHPPAAKTQEELAAYQAAAALATSDIGAAEKSADDFAAKYADSELRSLLYSNLMQVLYRGGHEGKALEAGRKVLAIDPTHTQTLVMSAQIIAERTKDTDLDRDEKFAEGLKYAETAINTIDTGLLLRNDLTPEQVAGAKAWLISNAYSSMAFIEFLKKNYSAAEDHYKKSIDADPANPDPTNLLRLAVALDKQEKYAEALTYADKAIAAADAGQMPDVSQLAKNEKKRLQDLTVKK